MLLPSEAVSTENCDVDAWELPLGERELLISWILRFTAGGCSSGGSVDWSPSLSPSCLFFLRSSRLLVVG